MGYRISYETGVTKKDKIKPRFGKRQGFLLLAISAVITAAALRYFGLTEKLWHYLLPGDGEVTSRALQVMLEYLQQGEGIVRAVTAFCRRILEGAQLV